MCDKCLLLLLSRFSCVRLCSTPWTADYQVPPSMGFSRQEYWSGLPLPSPFSLCCCQVDSVVSDSVRPHGLQPTRLLHPWDSPGKNTGVGCHFLLQRHSLVPLNFLPLKWYRLHIWGCRYFSQQSWFQLVSHPAQYFAWCTLHLS